MLLIFAIHNAGVKVVCNFITIRKVSLGIVILGELSKKLQQCFVILLNQSF